MAAVAPGTRIGHVHLKVADLDRAIGFYSGVLGFELQQRYGDQAAFLSAGGYHHHIGANTWESRGAGPPPAGTAALRHATIVLPDQGEREEVLRRIQDARQVAEESAAGPVVRDPSGNAWVLEAA